MYPDLFELLSGPLKREAKVPVGASFLLRLISRFRNDQAIAVQDHHLARLLVEANRPPLFILLKLVALPVTG